MPSLAATVYLFTANTYKLSSSAVFESEQTRKDAATSLYVLQFIFTTSSTIMPSIYMVLDIKCEDKSVP